MSACSSCGGLRTLAVLYHRTPLPQTNETGHGHRCAVRSLQHPKVKELVLDMASPAAFGAALKHHAAALAGHRAAFITLGVGAASAVTKAQLNETDQLLPLAFLEMIDVEHVSLMTAVRSPHRRC